MASTLHQTRVNKVLKKNFFLVQFQRVPQKYVQEFEELQNLMDPSRNMKTYRQLLLNSPPPLIPFFRTIESATLSLSKYSSLFAFPPLSSDRDEGRYVCARVQRGQDQWPCQL